MKRVICWILVAAIMLGFVGMIAFTAFAESVTPDVEITTPDYAAGSAATLDGVTVTGGTLNAETSGWWLAENGESVASDGVLEENTFYILRVGFNAPAGTYDHETVIFVNGQLWDGSYGYSGEGDFMEIEIEVDLRKPQAEYAELSGLPDEIQAGTAQLPEIAVVEGNAEVSGVRWIDTDKNAVTAFETGKAYYLEVTLVPAQGYEFRDWFDAYGNYGSHETQIIAADKAVALFRYSLLPSVGKVTLTTSGMAEGKPISGIKAEVTGDATLESISVYDTTAEEMVESGNFQAGRNYQITYCLTAKEGFEFGKDLEVDCNGNMEMGWSYDESNLYLTEYFSTCKKIEKVELTVTEPKLDAKIEDTKLTLPKDAPYTAQISWMDMEKWEPAEGTFRKGHRYQLSIDLEPAEGYVFAQELQVIVNGEEKQYGGTDSSGLYSWAYMEYSFMEKITKVELPARPDSIQKGDTLSTDFKVDEKANYTLEAQWGIMPEGGSPEKVEQNGSYVLVFNVTAKEGYEFADDVVVTIGGKKYTGLFLNYGNELHVLKSYNIGMKIIDKIELTVDAPNKGNTPKTPEFAKDAKFECMEHYWSHNKSGNIMDDSAQTKTFQEGYYHYLSLVLVAEDGYAFADEVDIYINGKKMKAVIGLNFGSYLQLGTSFGKLGKAGNADTADTMPVGAFVCMGVLALAGMAVTVAGKKKYCA